jgi:hypothetical protein
MPDTESDYVFFYEPGQYRFGVRQKAAACSIAIYHYGNARVDICSFYNHEIGKCRVCGTTLLRDQPGCRDIDFLQVLELMYNKVMDTVEKQEV